MKDEKGLIAQRGKGRISQPEGTRGAQMGVRKVPVREIEEADCAEMGQGQVILFTSFFSSIMFIIRGRCSIKDGLVKSLSHVQLFATSWTVAYQAPWSMGFSRQEYWSGLPFPSPEDLPNPGIEPGPPTLQTDALLFEPLGKPGLGKDGLASII